MSNFRDIVRAREKFESYLRSKYFVSMFLEPEQGAIWSSFSKKRLEVKELDV